MIEVGKMNTLRLSRENNSGYYLKSEDSDEEVFLPPSLVDFDINIGEEISVFVYHDKNNSLISTVKTPYAVVGEYACMEAINVQDFGAFFDWGIEKDLLVPGNEQKYQVNVGEKHLVRICLEAETERIYGTTKIGKYIKNSSFDIVEKDRVTIVPVYEEERGYQSIINKKFIGMIYYNEIFSMIELGEPYPGVVKKIRDDGLVDASLQVQSVQNLFEAKDKIIKMLKEDNGKSPLHDKSKPEDIYMLLGMSKKTFKSAIGMLFKEKKIAIKKDGISLI